MKILERLRGLASDFPIEKQSVEPGWGVTPLDQELVDYDAVYGLADDGAAEEIDAGFLSHTIDGLRRRLPDVHEEIPPESYELSETTGSLGNS